MPVTGVCFQMKDREVGAEEVMAASSPESPSPGPLLPVTTFINQSINIPAIPTIIITFVTTILGRLCEQAAPYHLCLKGRTVGTAWSLDLKRFFYGIGMWTNMRVGFRLMSLFYCKPR